MSCPCHAEAATFESRVPNPNLHLQSRCPLSCPNVVNRIKWIVLAVETEIHPDNGWKFDICRRTISSFGWFWSIPTMNVKLFWKLCCIVLHYARIVPALGGLFRDSWILILFFNQMNLDATNWFVWSGHLFFPWWDNIYVRKQFWLLSCSPCQSQIWSAKHPQTRTGYHTTNSMACEHHNWQTLCQTKYSKLQFLCSSISNASKVASHTCIDKNRSNGDMSWNCETL